MAKKGIGVSAETRSSYSTIKYRRIADSLPGLFTPEERTRFEELSLLYDKVDASGDESLISDAQVKELREFLVRVWKVGPLEKLVW